MARALRRLLTTFLILLLVIIALPVALVVALNSRQGRDFAVQQINQRSGGMIRLAGLGGHFPADLKLASLTLADARGSWLTASGLELRWRPRELLARRLHITRLRADELELGRLPAAGTGGKNAGGSIDLHRFTARLDQLTIARLGIGAGLAGQPMTLELAGNAQVMSLTQGIVNLAATAIQPQGRYRLAAALDDQNVNATLQAQEPPDGLIGHYAGASLRGPLQLDLTLRGPRQRAALGFSASLGAAAAQGEGTLCLDPRAPSADLAVTLPSLAPLGALANRKLAGSAKIHAQAALANHVTSLALDGDVALTQGPLEARLVGRAGHFATRLQLAGSTVRIAQLSARGAEFSAAAAGEVSAKAIALTTHLQLDQVGDLLPQLSGQVSADATITGRPEDLGMHAAVGGTIRQKAVPSGPFSLTLDAQHLPAAPTGTATGSGEVENAPLALNLAFARAPDGTTTLHIANATWRSVDVKADLALAAGAVLPTGSAKFSILRLADLSAFSPLPLQGIVRGDFAHRTPQDFALDATATNLVVSPSLGAIDGQLRAAGPLSRLAVTLKADFAKVAGAGLHLATTGTVNADTLQTRLSSFTASWKTLDLALAAPAAIDTRPALVVHHLALRVNGGRLALDGKLNPGLDLTLAASGLPASLARLASPDLDIAGTLAAQARITGTPAAPRGRVTLNAENIALRSGPAAALPPADLGAAITLAGSSAVLAARLTAGPDASLNANGSVPLQPRGAVALRLAGRVDLRLLDPFLAAQGTILRGRIEPDFTVTGTLAAPAVNGTLALSDGSAQNIETGLNLVNIEARTVASGDTISLQSLRATAGAGEIAGHGSIALHGAMPLDFAVTAKNASPVSSDLVSETLDADLSLAGALKTGMKLGGQVEIHEANINIPKSLPASVANLPIYRAGEKPPPAPAPPPKVALDLLIHAHNRIFIRGDGLFAELGGRVNVGGTLAAPEPTGGFTLIRGNYALGGKTLQFTKGVVSFNGAGFMPTLDLEATTYTTSTNNTATLVIGGTAAKPTITLTSSPPQPSDEVLSQLLFGESTQNLSAFQAASLAAALAQLSGIGGSAVSDPLGGIRKALGLDQLSLGGGASGGAPSVQAGRYVAPGVYVGIQQSTAGTGTQASVQINLYKGLKLQTQTGTNGPGSSDSSSVGLNYQFNY